MINYVNWVMVSLAGIVLLSGDCSHVEALGLSDEGALENVDGCGKCYKRGSVSPLIGPHQLIYASMTFLQQRHIFYACERGKILVHHTNTVVGGIQSTGF